MNTKIIRIHKILKEIRPEADFESSKNFIDDGLLDSLDIVIFVDSIEKQFNIKIDGESIIPENFANFESINSLIDS